MKKVIAYRNEGNLGNTIQTLGLVRLLGKTEGVWYDDTTCGKDDDTFVVNGWIFSEWIESFPADRDSLFCGIHVYGNLSEKAKNVLRKSKYPIGTRDPDTAKFLQGLDINAEYVGCGSMLFPRYDGPRTGKLSIDLHRLNGPGQILYQTIMDNVNESWEWRWNKSIERIEQLKTAEEVYTARLHVAIPCLAMGTPVYIERNQDTRRFSVLEELGVEYEKLIVLDIDEHKTKFKVFLEKHLNTKLDYASSVMPIVDETLKVKFY